MPLGKNRAYFYTHPVASVITLGFRNYALFYPAKNLAL